MTAFESAFLCGVLKKFHPKKILEVGIAAGGSTAIILQCLDMLQIEESVEMHSMDYLRHFYRDKKYMSGFLGQEAKDIIQNSKIHHQFHFGNIACSFMEEIGGDIDCLILDTTHYLPGEVWDFITLLPFLKDGAVVVLHDICLNQCHKDFRSLFATGTLFSTVVAEKYWNEDIERKSPYPNIGAFVVSQETRDYIVNVFLSLMISWISWGGGKKEKEQFYLYREFVEKYYSKELLSIFDTSFQLNDQFPLDIQYTFPFDLIRQNSKIVLYGAGAIGTNFYDIITQKKYCQIVKWVDRRYQEIQYENRMKIDSVDSICNVEFDAVLIAVFDEEIVNQIKQDLMQLGIPEQKMIWSYYDYEIIY